MKSLTISSSSDLRAFPPGQPAEEYCVHYNELCFRTKELESFASELQLIFEEQIYAFRSSNRTPYILDCGGHIGSSLLFYKKMYPMATVVVFEANPLALTYLYENIRLNKLDHVVVVGRPLYADCVPVEFVLDGKDGACIQGLGCVSGKKITVNAVRLSDYLKDRHVDMLKMNIEGAEYPVLNEAAPYLKHVDRIVFEYHGFSKEEQHLHKILAILDENRFQYVINSFPRNINGNAWPPFRITAQWFSLVYAEKRGLRS